MRSRPLPWGTPSNPHELNWRWFQFFEYKLLVAEEDDFEAYYDDHMSRQYKQDEDGPVTTGDPFIDALEKSLFERQKIGMGEPDWNLIKRMAHGKR